MVAPLRDVAPLTPESPVWIIIAILVTFHVVNFLVRLLQGRIRP